MTDRFQASRLTSGNLFFPAAINVDADGVHFVKRRVFGSNEEVIGYRQIASVKIQSGLFFADVQIETAGGSQPVVLRGLSKANATALRDAIQKMQQRA